MSVNKVTLIGNLGDAPETASTTNGTAVANVRMATTLKRRDKQTGAVQENTEWHRVVFFGRLAEIVAQYLRKGSKVYIEGRLRTRKWQGQDGQDRYTTEIVANEMQMLDSRGGQGGGQGYAAQSQQPQPQQQPAQQVQQPQAVPQQGQPVPQQPQGDDFFDDDVPF